MATEETREKKSDSGEISPPVIRMLGKARGRSMGRRRFCRFCADDTIVLDYKNPNLIKNFITERGKLIPRRIAGNCAKHQRALALAVRRARMIALVPFAVTGR